MSFLDGLSNQFSAFGKKTKDFADSTRLSSMASDEQRTISDIHREIGKLYASLHKTDHEACFDALFARLAQAEENLQRYTQQIQDLRARSFAAPAARPCRPLRRPTATSAPIAAQL